MGLDHEQARFAPEAHGGKRDRRGIAAMAVEDEEALQAGARDLPAEGDPGGCQKLRLQGQRARKIAMLARPADGLGRQHDGASGSARRRRGGEDAVQDHGIGAGGQMGAMLLGRSHRQDRHRPDVQPGEVGRRHLGP